MPKNPLLLPPQVTAFEPARVLLSCAHEVPTDLSLDTIVLQRNPEGGDQYSVMAHFIDAYRQRKSVPLSQDQVFNLERLMINASALDEEERAAIDPAFSDIPEEVCVDIPGIPTSFYYAVILSVMVPTLNEKACRLYLMPRLPEAVLYQDYKESYICLEEVTAFEEIAAEGSNDCLKGNIYYIDCLSQISRVKLDNMNLFMREIGVMCAHGRGTELFLSKEEMNRIIFLNGGHAEDHFQTRATQLFGPLSADKLYILKAIFVNFNGTWDSLRVEQLADYMKLFRARVYQYLSNNRSDYFTFYPGAEGASTPVTDELFSAYLKARARDERLWPELLEVEAAAALLALDIDYCSSLAAPLPASAATSAGVKSIRLKRTVVEERAHYRPFISGADIRDIPRNFPEVKHSLFSPQHPQLAFPNEEQGIVEVAQERYPEFVAQVIKIAGYVHPALVELAFQAAQLGNHRLVEFLLGSKQHEITRSEYDLHVEIQEKDIELFKISLTFAMRERYQHCMVLLRELLKSLPHLRSDHKFLTKSIQECRKILRVAAFQVLEQRRSKLRGEQGQILDPLNTYLTSINGQLRHYFYSELTTFYKAIAQEAFSMISDEMIQPLWAHEQASAESQEEFAENLSYFNPQEDDDLSIHSIDESLSIFSKALPFNGEEPEELRFRGVSESSVEEQGAEADDRRSPPLSPVALSAAGSLDPAEARFDELMHQLLKANAQALAENTLMEQALGMELRILGASIILFNNRSDHVVDATMIQAHFGERESIPELFFQIPQKHRARLLRSPIPADIKRQSLSLAYVGAYYGHYFVYAAVVHKAPELAGMQTDQGVLPLQACDRDTGNTLLHTMVAKGEFTALHLLLTTTPEAYYDLNQRNQVGFSALRQEHVGRDQCTPLIDACRRDMPEFQLFQFWLNAGADPLIRAGSGETLLQAILTMAHPHAATFFKTLCEHWLTKNLQDFYPSFLKVIEDEMRKVWARKNYSQTPLIADHFVSTYLEAVKSVLLNYSLKNLLPLLERGYQDPSRANQKYRDRFLDRYHAVDALFEKLRHALLSLQISEIKEFIDFVKKDVRRGPLGRSAFCSQLEVVSRRYEALFKRQLFEECRDRIVPRDPTVALAINQERLVAANRLYDLQTIHAEEKRKSEIEASEYKATITELRHDIKILHEEKQKAKEEFDTRIARQAEDAAAAKQASDALLARQAEDAVLAATAAKQASDALLARQAEDAAVAAKQAEEILAESRKQTGILRVALEAQHKDIGETTVQMRRLVEMAFALQKENTTLKTVAKITDSSEEVHSSGASRRALLPASAFFSRKQITHSTSVVTRKGLISISTGELSALLNLPECIQIGTAVDDGGCFFDAFAQALNSSQETSIHTEKSLRMACLRYYLASPAHRSKIDRLHQKDYCGSKKALTYSSIGHTKLEADERGLSRPIWGRPHIEGRILCDVLDLEALHLIEIMINPDDDQPIVIHSLMTRNGVMPLEDEEIPSYHENIPTLVLSQRDLHFIPLLLNPVETTLQNVASEKASPDPTA